jgi:hypothetical protein
MFLEFVENHKKQLYMVIDAWGGEGTAGRIRQGNAILKSVYVDDASQSAR